MMDLKAAYIKGLPIRSKAQMPYALTTIPIDSEWDKAILSCFWYHTTSRDAFRQKDLFDLRALLLSLGGSEVCLPMTEPDSQKILLRGQLWYGDRMLTVSGQQNRCHGNSAYLWKNNSDTMVLCTGYALSKDGMWRQHSWCVEPRVRKSRIVETTTERVAYFGFVLSETEAEAFCEENY